LERELADAQQAQAELAGAMEALQAGLQAAEDAATRLASTEGRASELEAARAAAAAASAADRAALEGELRRVCGQVGELEGKLQAAEARELKLAGVDARIGELEKEVGVTYFPSFCKASWARTALQAVA
jgi:chromosome segregation ATPase